MGKERQKERERDTHTAWTLKDAVVFRKLTAFSSAGQTLTTV